MTDEHFGIGVVEMMSAGLFTIAHDSAGPKFDIIGGKKNDLTGGLATSVTDYENWIVKAIDQFNSSTLTQL